MVGMPVYSSDNKALGQAVDVVKGPDDTVQSIQVDIGRRLGLGTKVVTTTADKLERAAAWGQGVAVRDRGTVLARGQEAVEANRLETLRLMIGPLMTGLRRCASRRSAVKLETSSGDGCRLFLMSTDGSR